jgi:hypothetical protein
VRKGPAIRIRIRANGGTKRYRYAGFVEREGVRYLGQSVLFVPVGLLEEFRSFLHSENVDHVAMTAWLGAVMPS